MFIERLVLSNFRCFGPDPCMIDLAHGLTAFVGDNGTGKTAAMLALQRMFGITNEQRRVCRQDFHVPVAEVGPTAQRSLVVEVIVAFPELDQDGGDQDAVPEFFHQMAADDAGRMKCRLRLQASWTDDGSLDGFVEQKVLAIRKFGEYAEGDTSELSGMDRGRVQMIYVPASRDAASQVTAFLRGRIWRAINWSQRVRDTFADAGGRLNEAFEGEAGVDIVAETVKRRWQEVHSAGTDTVPIFRPVDLRFHEFIRHVHVMFHPDEAGRERALEDLSDGQRSLFHFAMTAATLDVEAHIAANRQADGFQGDDVVLPALTLIAIEEPENSLAPFYLARIIRQIDTLTSGTRAQAVVSSHSASILSRVEPERVRHFRLNPNDRTAKVRSIRLPAGDEDASKFVREAILSYPELYFARFVVLGEGASEEVVVPRIARALGCDIDPSFVAVVPLGGRHVNHMWRLLTMLEIPHATLLDLDWGRSGGGWGRIKTICAQLLENGATPAQVFGDLLSPAGPATNLAEFDARNVEDFAGLDEWVRSLRRLNVFFSAPLDLDYSMLRGFPGPYKVVEPGGLGPARMGDPRTSVLGDDARPNLYDVAHDESLRWYRYLFLGRGKPSTHVRAMSNIDPENLAANAPEELRALIDAIRAHLEPPLPDEV